MSKSIRWTKCFDFDRLLPACPLMQSEGRLNKFGPVQSSSEVHFVTVPLTNLVVSKYYTDYKSHIIEEMQFAWCQVRSSTAATKWVRNFCSTDPAPLIKYFDWPTPPPVPSYDHPLWSLSTHISVYDWLGWVVDFDWLPVLWNRFVRIETKWMEWIKWNF